MTAGPPEVYDAVLRRAHWTVCIVCRFSGVQTQAFFDAVDGMRVSLGPAIVFRYVLLGLFHPAKKVSGALHTTDVARRRRKVGERAPQFSVTQEYKLWSMDAAEVCHGSLAAAGQSSVLQSRSRQQCPGTRRPSGYSPSENENIRHGATDRHYQHHYKSTAQRRSPRMCCMPLFRVWFKSDACTVLAGGGPVCPRFGKTGGS